jgi:hypothetical protein
VVLGTLPVSGATSGGRAFMILGAWFSFDDEERRDAERVRELEGLQS